MITFGLGTYVMIASCGTGVLGEWEAQRCQNMIHIEK
jgi:hypothetical protein